MYKLETSVQNKIAIFCMEVFIMFKRRTKGLALLLVLVLAVTVMTASAVNENAAPVAENLEITTYRGISVGGRLRAVDPDGDLLTFDVTTPPTKGTLELSKDGHFVYTPADGKKGKDYFGYKAADSKGNLSQEATVIIRLLKQKTDVRYADTAGLSCDYAAHALAEAGVLVGQCIAGDYVFEPEREISRGEFLSMCMKAVGTKTLSGVRSTGFLDDDDIPMWVKPYVSTALLNGSITGFVGENGTVFDADACVSYNEAAVMLSRVMNVTDVVNTAAYVDDTAPSWASQSVANLAACHILDTAGVSLSDGLTRAQAAQMLVRAMAMRDSKA
jgi:hypothetical protein